MMRWIVCGMALLCLTAVSEAQWSPTGGPMIGQGVRELGLSGGLDDDGEDMGGNIAVRFGYFIADGIEAGVFTGAAWRGSHYSAYGAGGFGEYNFDVASPIVPYAGGGAAVGRMERNNDATSYLEFEAWGGAKVFFIDYAAIALDLVLRAATEEIYGRNGEVFDWGIRLGTRWYF